MKEPTQCVLWLTPELTDAPNFFEHLEAFVDEPHWSRDLLRCRECGQLYIHDFYEVINWSGGDDSQYAFYAPVETKEEIDSIKGVSSLEVLKFYPHLAKDITAGNMCWVKEGEPESLRI